MIPCGESGIVTHSGWARGTVDDSGDIGGKQDCREWTCFSAEFEALTGMFRRRRGAFREGG